MRKSLQHEHYQMGPQLQSHSTIQHSSNLNTDRGGELSNQTSSTGILENVVKNRAENNRAMSHFTIKCIPREIIGYSGTNQATTVG
jgi:hypothetical protein